MAEKKTKTAKELKAEYETLARQAAGFDGETKALLRKHEEAGKKLVSDRKVVRERLLAEKLRAYRELTAAEAAERKPEPAKVPEQKPQIAGEKAEA